MKPILGNFPKFKGKQFQFLMEELRDKYGPMIGLKFGKRYMIMVCGPKEVKEVLKHDALQGRPNFVRNSDKPRQGKLSYI